MLNELSRYDVSLKKMFRESQRKTDQVKKLRVHPYQSTINRTDGSPWEDLHPGRCYVVFLRKMQKKVYLMMIRMVVRVVYAGSAEDVTILEMAMLFAASIEYFILPTGSAGHFRPWCGNLAEVFYLFICRLVLL